MIEQMSFGEIDSPETNVVQTEIDPVTGRKDEFVTDDAFSYAGYQITREEFFAHSREPALSICGNKL